MKNLPDDLILPPRTLIKRGAAGALLKECASFGKRGILVHGHSLQSNGALESICASSPTGLKVQAWEHPGGEPNLYHLSDLLRTARVYNAEWIAGVGGGSVLDLAKACAGLMHAKLKPEDYHDGAPVSPSRLPFIAVPTTAGTGSEATPVCVLTNAVTGVKKSFRHPSFTASLVILDAGLLANCPRSVVASAGMDAFTQAFESFTSRHATAFTDSLSLMSMSLIGSSLEHVFDNPAHEGASDLLQGSFIAGVALSNARLGIVHGLAHPLGARYHVPHGLACAFCLPHAIEFNRESIGDKYARAHEALNEDPAAFSARLLLKFHMSSPFAGKVLADRENIIKETLASGSTAANPRTATASDISGLLDRIFAA